MKAWAKSLYKGWGESLLTFCREEKAMDGKGKIKEVVERLKKNPNVLSIFLFGSRATGKANEKSDVDIAVILENADFESRMEVEELQREGIDIVILNTSNPLFILSAIRDGKVLFERNKKDVEMKYKLARKFANLYGFLRKQGLVE